ncbi:ankyrin repeat domain-containing protein 40-like [Diabrotica undecimpunctata]|uniref:ankyrin repeat domain-containing protein 40-like n=1 Tax=Diabrotica undecimpunctata TaxID=50387 RepID=UPI003B6367C1
MYMTIFKVGLSGDSIKMANILEEKLREAVSIGDVESVNLLLSQKINVNSQNNMNGWTALHWAYKRGNNHLIKLLIDHGANGDVRNSKGQTPQEVSPYYVDLNSKDKSSDDGLNYVPNYLKNPPLSVDLGTGHKKQKTTDCRNAPVPTSSSEEEVLVLPVKIFSSSDPDFIEIEIIKSNLTYANLLRVCCQELGILESQVERVRKLPNIRLRNDNDVKRLRSHHLLEVVLTSPLHRE